MADLRQLLRRGQDSISESEVTEKEIKNTDFVPPADPEPRVALLVLNVERELKSAFGLNQMPRSFILLPSSILLFGG